MAARRQPNPHSESVDDYLKAILALGGTEEDRATSTALADRLGVAPASVTNMLQKLAAISGLNKGWLRAVFDPQMGIALRAIHDRVKTPWTVESLAEAAGMSRSAFAARFKELLGQTPLEDVTEWRMRKAMPLLQQREKKLIDVGRSVTSPA